MTSNQARARRRKTRRGLAAAALLAAPPAVAGRDTWQEKICATGGADGQNGYRTLYNASVMAAQTTDASSRIGLSNEPAATAAADCMQVTRRRQLPAPGSRRSGCLLAALVTLLVVCSCSNSGSEHASAADPLRPAAGFGERCRGGSPPDLLLFIAGEDPFNANLYVEDLCRWRARPVSVLPDGKISAVSVAGPTVAVTAARTNVDQVFVLERGALRPVNPGEAGRSATAGPDNAIAFVAIGNDRQQPFAIETAGPSGPSVVYRSSNPLNPVVFASTRAAMVVGESPTKPGTLEPTRATFLTVLPERRRLDLQLSRVSGMAYLGSRHAVAVSGESNEAGDIVPLSGGKRGALPVGWRVNGFEDAGSLLLMTRSGTLGVVDLGSGTELLTLPRTTAGAVYGAAWLDRRHAERVLGREVTQMELRGD